MTNLTRYLLLFLLIAQTGFPFFVGNTWLLIVFLFTAIVFNLKRKKWSKYIVRYLFAFILLMTMQIIFLGNFEAGPFVGILIRIIYAFMAIKLIGPDFMKYYVKFLYVFAIIGLFFWLILAFIPNMYALASLFNSSSIEPLTLYLEQVRINLIIYTNDYWLLDKLPRNAGPFWEPGAFGVFLIVAILFNSINKGTLINRKNIIFIIAMITTFSLGTYSVFLIFLFSYLFFIKKIKMSTLFYFIVIFLVAMYSYNSFDFLGEKFEYRYVRSMNFSSDMTYAKLNYQVGRNEKAILDVRAFLASPIVGEGQFIQYEFGNSPSGVTAFLRKWGVLGFLLVFGTMYYSFKRYMLYADINKKFAIVAVITLIAVAIPQSLYGKPIFLGFSFLFLIFSKKEMILKLKNHDIKNETPLS